jgi:hypothetical protein
MKQKIRIKRKLLTPKTILRLPDLDVAKSAVLNSLSCPDAQRGYRHAIDELENAVHSQASIRIADNPLRATVAGRKRV